MKFELLPNEILIECFEFLNIFDIYYSFNQLNDHLNRLIRTIPLHLNFQYVQKSIFDKLCQFLLLNPDVKQQIYSLKLSDKDTCGQIEVFLSYFSLEQFSRLQSLTLIQVEQNNMKKLKSMLSLIPQLFSFHLIESEDIILTCPLTSNLRILSIPTLQSIIKPLLITNLTISICSFDQLLHQLFKYAPMLTYLNIHSITEYYSSMINHPSVITYKAVHLKELIISNFEYKFKDFEKLAKYIPKLTSLKLYGNYDTDMINANRWEHLIISSLLFLDTFKFIFSYIYRTDNDNILYKLNQFQSDFWQKQHQWYTEYSLSEYSASIYTVPYMLNSFQLELNTERHWNQLLNTFDNVTNLTLYHAVIKESCQYYFPNVHSLTILPSEPYYRPRLGVQAIRSLKTIVNLANLKHFGISLKFYMKDPSALLKILEESPQLSSVNVNIRALETFSYNKDLCACLNKMITKLDIYKYGSSSFKFNYELQEFCKTFSNTEQLKCNIDQANDLLFLLKHLPKLSILKAYLWSINDHQYFHSWFEKATRKLNLLFSINYIDKYETELLVWIDRNVNFKSLSLVNK